MKNATNLINLNVNKELFKVDLSGCIKGKSGLSLKTERKVKKVLTVTYGLALYILAVYGLVQLFS